MGFVGKAKEATSVWVVIASVGVVALAGVVLRVERANPTRETPVERRLERERRAELLRHKLRQLDERLLTKPSSPKDADVEDAGDGAELPLPAPEAR